MRMHETKQWAATSLLLLATSLFLIHDYNTSVHGYVAVYTVLLMWIICAVAILPGLALLIRPAKRQAGIYLLAFSLGLPFLFFGGIRFSESLGWIVWQNQPLRQFGPAAKSSAIVYFDTIATDADIEAFRRTALCRSRVDGRGEEFKPGIVSYLRLLPSQANGFNGAAIDFSRSISREQLETLRRELGAHRLVHRVYYDQAPADIPPPPTH